MISAEAPVLFAKAAEIFIHELTLRAWIHTEDNKRRTLQRNDIAMAITKYDQFDFLIDIVPRDELKPTKKEETKTTTVIGAEQVQYYLQLAQQHNAALQQSTGQVQIIQPGGGVQTLQLLQGGQTAQVIQQPQILGQTLGGGQIVLQQGGAQMFQQQQQQSGGIQLLQQVVCPNGEVQNVPIQLSASQLQMLRMQIQTNAAAAQTGQNQQIILQTAPIQQTVVSTQNATQIIHG